MKTIAISVRDKIAINMSDVAYTCGNSDFVINFDFDAEWDAFDVKTARFVKEDRTYQDQVFQGNECPVPIIYNTNKVRVGVFAGNLHTSTPAIISANKGILCGNGSPEAPSDDVYAQIMEQIRGFLKAETDPTVPTWAKEETKPSYSKSEVGLGNVDNVKQYSERNPPPYPVTSVNGKTGTVSLTADDVGARPNNWMPTASDVMAHPVSTPIPTRTSDLINDSVFITNATSDLVNYYLKSETLTKAEINALVSAIPKFSIQVVSALPTSEISTTTVYLVAEDSADGNLYTEYIYANGKWEILGSQRVDLTGYATEIYVKDYVADALSGHNTDETAHPDIRKALEQLSNEKADQTEVDDLKANGVQQVPLYAETTEDCTDTTKLYVLPDGYLYAYKEVTTEGGAGYTNQVPISTDTDGSIYNGTGYKDNVRLSSSGGVSSTAQAGSVTTGFIPCTNSDVLRMKGAEWVSEMDASAGHYYVNFYDSSKNFIVGVAASAYKGGAGTYGDGITYDETTGITTFDWDNTTMGSNGTNTTGAAYIRLNAYGSGADLIVTVNEEIEESGSTTSYQWVSTGHAFVPADYEDRIVELERQVEEHEEAVTELEQQVSDIIEGNTQIAANAKFDPTVYGLPVLYLTGDTAPIAVSKDNKVTLEYTYGDLSGTCTLKGQGATSYKTAQALVNAGKAGKFNYTIKFDTAFEAATGWGGQKKYCLKANFIDATHSRNVCSCKLWGMSVKSRSVVPSELADLPNGGAIDGFPIVIMLNGEFHGLYTWNIPKDGWMFGLVEDTTKTQAIVGADDHTTATQMKEASMTGFEVEFVSDEDNADWVETSLTQMLSAVMNSDGSDLDTTVAQYLDLDSVIDHYIHTVVDKATDCVDKNYLLVTFDGTKWYMSEYDRDSIHGLNWDASGTTRPVSNVSFAECAETVKIYELIKNYKADALKARYAELRGNVLSESRIMQTFENFAWAIPSPVMLEDVKLYPTILGSGVNTIDQIGRFVRQRLETCDAWIDAL